MHLPKGSYPLRVARTILGGHPDVYAGEETVCASTEELLAEIEELNKGGRLNESDIIGSMDVEALYPSLDIDFTVEKVCEMLHDSKVTFEGINYKELGLYLSLVMNDEELRRRGVDAVCPTRRARRGPRPNITGCGMRENEEERHKPWVFPDLTPVGADMKRKMLVEAVRIVLKTLLETHTYDFAGEIRKQKEGGAIGMELTGVVAQIFMTWWDKEFKRKLEEVSMQLKLHQRYVDDTNLAGEQTEPGVRYMNGAMAVTEESRDEDEGLPADERTMKVLQSIANSIHPSIRMTIDYPSKNAGGKVPMLDIKSWIEEADGRRVILYEHYEKDMATKAVIHASSAIPKRTKRTILTQEMLRIMLHCSRYLPWEVVRTHLNKFMMKLQYSGYDQEFRHEVAKSAINAYETIRDNEELGIRPMHRPKGWRKVERLEEKERKKKTWYTQGGFDSVLFVPATRNSKLKQNYQHVIRKSGFRVKVVERAGKTLKSQLQTSNPFRANNCGREDCFVCTTSGKGNCNTESITYRIDCLGEGCVRYAYKGESASNGYTRGLEHLKNLNRHDVDNSPLWRHCVTQHGGNMQSFSMSITGTYRNDAMLRQITEAVQINNTNREVLMNDRTEWNMTPVPRAVTTTT